MSLENAHSPSDGDTHNDDREESPRRPVLSLCGTCRGLTHACVHSFIQPFTCFFSNKYLGSTY